MNVKSVVGVRVDGSWHEVKFGTWREIDTRATFTTPLGEDYTVFLRHVSMLKYAVSRELP